MAISSGGRTTKDSHESELLHQAFGGGAAALMELLIATHPELCAYIARRLPADLRGAIDAEDIAQEAHIEVFCHFDSLQRRDRATFWRWVLTIGLHKLRSAIKRQRAAKRGHGRREIVFSASPEDSATLLLNVLAGVQATPSRVAAGAEARRALQAALALLPGDCQRAVELVCIEGRTAADAATVMGRTERAIHNLCHKAKGLLRERLGSGSRFLSSSG